ncbi:hypothetical protein ACSS6W_000171 [Trichoderma asperelloides]
MQASRLESSFGKAPKACKFCRSRKKKCDKALPRCGFCARQAPPEWSSLLVDQERLHAQAVDLPTILFLDPDLLLLGQVETLHTVQAIPQIVLQFLGGLDEIRLTADKFFGHIHQWMPFISKKRFYDLYMQPSFHSRPDVALLLLALKLITTLPLPHLPNPRTALYHTVKHFYLEVESSLSLLVLQAGILVALYELGHGIYPAAFLSIGKCGRYAHALGIDTSRTVPATRVLTLVEVEERRRVWWAIVILDRDSAGQDNAWVQLDRTLQSMLAAALDVDRPDYDQITFVYRDYSRRARDVLHQITGRISANLVERRCFLGRDPEDVSPWGLYFAYRICGVLMRPSERALHGAEVMESLREAFQTISVRWNVASVYLELLEARKAISLGSLSLLE